LNYLLKQLDVETMMVTKIITIGTNFQDWQLYYEISKMSGL